MAEERSLRAPTPGGEAVEGTFLRSDGYAVVRDPAGPPGAWIAGYTWEL